jgi:hypothetical protein
MPHITGKSLHYSLNDFKKPQILRKASISLKMNLKNLAIFESPSHLLKKASIFLKMSSKRIKIFKKPQITLKKPKILLKYL